MNIELEKSKLVKLLEETNDESIIASMLKLFNAKKKDFWDELTEEQKFEIEESDREIDRGEFVLYEDLMKKYR
jgi:single-stranded DNA-specific DHH superfamily exonuclease